MIVRIAPSAGPATRPPLAARTPVEVVAPARLAPPPPGGWQAGWVDPDGTWWVARGVAAAWQDDKEGGPAPMALDRAREALAGLAGDAAGLRAFGAMAFDPARPLDPLGFPVPVARFVLPRWLLRVPAASVAAGGRAEAWVVVPGGGQADDSEATDARSRLAAEKAALRRWAGTPAAPAAWPAPGPAAWPAPGPTAAGPAAVAGPEAAIGVTPAGPDDMGPAAWDAAIAAALDAIAAGGLRKVVLARRRIVATSAPLPPWTAFATLAARAPGTARFALIGPDGAAFVGASPERLVALAGDRLAADVLAGTAARGADPATDEARLAALHASAKDAHEHAVVREAVLAALAPLTTGLTAPPAPEALALPTVWHLRTPVAGRLRPGVGLGEVVRALHPTPAVGGAPTGDALALIRRLEPHGRGCYAGPVGWVSADAAYLAVGIRSAHLRGDRAAAMAGCGIVPGSVAAAEWAETERKLAPMLAVLTGGTP